MSQWFYSFHSHKTAFLCLPGNIPLLRKIHFTNLHKRNPRISFSFVDIPPSNTHSYLLVPTQTERDTREFALAVHVFLFGIAKRPHTKTQLSE